MRTLTSLALALAAGAAPAMAADATFDVPPPVVYGDCPVPAVEAQARPPEAELPTIFTKVRSTWVQPPRVVTVEPFAGTIPGPPKYIEPQTAWLASSECPPSLGHRPGGSWYDGKTFYYEGTTPQRPDEFMIVVEPSELHRAPRLRLRVFDREFWTSEYPGTPEPGSE